MTNQPQTFIFTGRSGCGKGTQLKLLRKVIEEKDPSRQILASVTGDMFRSFFSDGTLTSELSKVVTDKGQLQPLFLVVWLWAKDLIERLKPEHTLFIDGYPRIIEESVAVDSMLSFYGRKGNVIILNFIVSRESSKARMFARNRADDTPENAETRLDWYDEKVAPAIDFFRNKEGYTFYDIDGEKTIEEIHQDILNKLNLA